jgi:hypothetical protein
VSTVISEERESWRADPDYSRAVLEDLYRYRLKQPWIAWLLWMFTGLMGGHRLYLEHTGTGILMLFTGGGLTLWWLLDALRLPGMIAAYNSEQERRKASGLPPISLAFMPPLGEGQVSVKPAWAANRGGRARLVGDALVLLVSGVVLGKTTAVSGNFEGLTAILALIAITNLGARWDRFARLPLLRALDRWSHRLRLFYHANDPGGPLSLLFRPVVGLVSALLDKRASAEVRLYLQLGGTFVIAFAIVDVASALVSSGGAVDDSLNAFIEDMLYTFVTVYAFASPIGATLTTHLLLERTDSILWALSGLTVVALVLGFFG